MPILHVMATNTPGSDNDSRSNGNCSLLKTQKSSGTFSRLAQMYASPQPPPGCDPRDVYKASYHSVLWKCFDRSLLHLMIQNTVNVINLAVGLFVVFLSYLWYRRRARAANLPPGPRGWPIIGNLLEMPTEYSWKVFDKWCKEFDTGILYLNMAGTHVVVLNSYEDCSELLDKRSSLYSGRIKWPMIELLGWDFNFAGRDYGDIWRAHRRLMHDSFQPSAVKSFRPIQLQVARRLVTKLANTTDVVPALRKMTGESIIRATYGIDVKPVNDPYLMAAEEGVRILVQVPYPGAFMVDVLPFLKYLPEWMPGASFKRKAREWKIITERILNAPFEGFLREMKEGTAKPSFSYNGIQAAATKGGIYTDENLKVVAGTIYQTGADTSAAAIGTCILSLLEYPEVMKKIQAEIDAATDGTRFPEEDDEEALPYLHAFIKESMRYWAFVPLSIAHYLAVDDEYKGYRLPAGSMIVPNAWAILHDEKVFPEPFKLKPERFLEGDNLKAIYDQFESHWGFGRRICPGRHMAAYSIWITLAQVLAVYDISKLKDKDGNIIEPRNDFPSSGILISPPEYQCSFTPRSKEAELLLMSLKDEE